MSYESRQNNCGIEIGDSVLVYRESLDYYRGWCGCFNRGCQLSLNKVGTVMEFSGDYGIYVAVPNGEYCLHNYFPYFVLRKVHPLYNQSKKIKKFETVVRRQERKVLRRLTRA